MLAEKIFFFIATLSVVITIISIIFLLLKENQIINDILEYEMYEIMGIILFLLVVLLFYVSFPPQNENLVIMLYYHIKKLEKEISPYLSQEDDIKNLMNSYKNNLTNYLILELLIALKKQENTIVNIDQLHEYITLRNQRYILIKKGGYYILKKELKRKCQELYGFEFVFYIKIFLYKIISYIYYKKNIYEKK